MVRDSSQADDYLQFRLDGMVNDGFKERPFAKAKATSSWWLPHYPTWAADVFCTLTRFEVRSDSLLKSAYFTIW